MAHQHAKQLTPQQHARIAHILERLPTHHHPPPSWLVKSDGKGAAVSAEEVEEVMRGMREEVKKLEAMDGEAVAVDGIVSLEVCLSLAQVVAWMRMSACRQVQELAIEGLPWQEEDVSVEGWEQAMDVFFASLAQLPATSSQLLCQLRLGSPFTETSEVLGRERVCAHLAQLLTSSAAPSWLRSITLWCTSMGAEGMRHIADALRTNTTLKELKVFDSPKVGNAGVEHLSAMLLENATLEELHLLYIGMTGHGSRHLCHALSSSASPLKVLDICGQKIATGADVAEQVGQLLANNTSLEKLRIHDCKLEDMEGRIAHGLRNNCTLRHLRLPLMGRSDLKMLFSAVASNTSLHSLSLYTKSIEMLLPRTAPELGEILAQNCCLQNLYWYHNEESEKDQGTAVQIRNRGQDEEGHFEQALRNNSALQEIRIPAGVLGERELEQLFTSLATYNTTLRKLRIPNAPSGGVPELALMLSRNRSLQELDLSNAGYSPHDWATFVLPALADNQGLKHVDFEGCDGIDGDAVLDAFISLLRNNTLLDVIDLDGTGLARAGRAEVVKEELKLNKEFRATLSTVPSANPRLCRIVLCGKEYAGKSTLLRTLKRVVHGPAASALSCFGLPASHLLGKQKIVSLNPHDKELSQRTRGIDIDVLKDEDELRLSVWDFAGHREYHALHDIIFPGVSNGTTVFVFTCSPIMGPTERSPGEMKTYDQMKEELLYWLRFIVSNMKPCHSHKSSVLVLVTHKDHLKNKVNMTIELIKNAVSEVVQEFKFADVVSMPIEPQFVNVKDDKEVAALLARIEELCKEKLKLVPKQPVICERVGIALQDMNQLQGNPIITTHAFKDLCKALAEKDHDRSLQAFFAIGDKGWRAVAAYLDSAGEVIYDGRLQFIVKSPKWFGHGILGHLINIFSDECSEEGLTQRRNLFTCCFSATRPSVNTNIVELPKNGLLTRGALKNLLLQALQSVPQLESNSVDADDLVELMKYLNLCFQLNADDPNSPYLIPAIFEDSAGQLAAKGMRPLKWREGKANSCCFGRRLECADRERTFLTPGFFPKLQVVLRNKAVVEAKWVPDGNSSNCSMEKYLFMITVNGMQIFVEYGGYAGYFVDILVKSSRNHVETLQFVQAEIISVIRSFCASHKGCQGVTLAESIIRPGCVSGPTLCAYRRDQAISLQELTRCMANFSSDYMHDWSDLKDDDGFVILEACADDAKSLIEGAGSFSIVAPATVSGDERGYPKYIVVSSTDVSKYREFVASVQVFGRAVPFKFHLKCECRAGAHDVDQQEGRVFYLVNDRFATEQGLRMVVVGTAAVAAQVVGYLVPAVGVAGGVLGSLPAYNGTPVYAETIESLMSVSGSKSSGTVSVEQLRVEVERDMQGSLAGPWMDAFLKPQDFQAFFSDFKLRKVVYKDTSAIAWLCNTHFKEGRRTNVFQKVN